MKKIIYSTLICFLTVLVGCDKDETFSEEATTPAQKATVTANIQGSGNSRVTLTPDVNAAGEKIVKVDWKESEESFKVYGWMQGAKFGSVDFTQTAGNQFEGDTTKILTDIMAIYGQHTLESEKIVYDLSEQDGTLNETHTIMAAGITYYSDPIHFEHKTAIVKTTFKLNDINIDAKITKIVMKNVYVNSKYQNNEGTITITPDKQEDIYIYLLRDFGAYTEGHVFEFEVTIENGKTYEYSLTIPYNMSIVKGKYYTATLNAYSESTMPDGTAFNTKLIKIDQYVTQIIFEANSERTTGTVINADTEEGDSLVRVTRYPSGGEIILYVSTPKSGFIFQEDCEGMFAGLTSLKSVNFNNCVSTPGVTEMQNMFSGCTNLKTISGWETFSTKNVTSMTGMFFDCHALTGLNLSHMYIYHIDY